MNQKIVVNTDGANEYHNVDKRSFASFGMVGNNNVTSLTQDVWAPFVAPTIPMQIGYQSINEWTIGSPNIRIVYNGANTKWFHMTATANIFKSGGGATRTIELIWYKNGAPIGWARQYQSNTEANIATGTGMVELSTGDYLEPWCRNIESSDAIRLDNFSVTLSQEVVDYFH
jgi:hypothetical protein